MAKVPAEEMDFFEKVGYVFSLWNESWEALKLNIWTFVVLYLIPLGLTMVLAMLYFIPFIDAATGNDSFSATSAVVVFFATLLVIFVYIVILPVVTLTQLESAKGKKVSLDNMFNRGLKYLPACIIFSLVFMGAIGLPLLVSILLIPFVIGILMLPLVVLWATAISVFAMLVPYIIINENLGGIAAIKKSIDIVKVKWQWVLAVYAVFLLVSFVSGFIPFIGYLISLAFGIVYFCMPAIVYVRHIADKPVAAKAEAKDEKAAPKKQTAK